VPDRAPSCWIGPIRCRGPTCARWTSTDSWSRAARSSCIRLRAPSWIRVSPKRSTRHRTSPTWSCWWRRSACSSRPHCWPARPLPSAPPGSAGRSRSPPPMAQRRASSAGTCWGRPLCWAPFRPRSPWLPACSRRGPDSAGCW